MTDIFSQRKRSEIMSRIRSSGNKSTEIRLIGIFRTAGIKGWRRNIRLPGNPDFVFVALRVAVFVDGCFWHGCRRCCHSPRSNSEYWRAKIERNVLRDKQVARTLQTAGWKVIRIWEHELVNPQRVVRRMKQAGGQGTY